MRRSRLLPALVAGALLIAACSSSGDDDGTSAAPGGDDTETVSEETEVAEEAYAGDPLPVTMQLEAGTASTTPVGPEGANIGATAADGTEYALRIPPGALAETVDIVMTPLVGLTGLPDGADLAFGVSLEPSGLIFGRPSWLFVTSDVEPDEVTGLSIHDDEAKLSGIGFDGEHFVLPVVRFSGGAACYLIGCGGDPPGGGRGGGWPGFPDSPAGPGQPGGPPTNPGPLVPPYEPPGSPPGPFPGDDGSSGGSNPTGHGSLTDGATGGTQSGTSGGTDAAVADALGDLARSQLTGDEEGEARANEKLDKVKERVKNEAWDAAKACVNEKDITKLKEILHWVIVGQLLGAAKDDAEEERLTSLIASCNKFEMETIGDLEFRLGGDVFVIGDSITATIPLPSEDGVSYTGEAVAEVEPVGYDRGAEFLELLAFGMGAAMGIDVPNNVSQNDYISCGVAPKGRGKLTALATNMLASDGPDVLLAIASARDASVNCPDPIGTFSMPPWVMDLPIHIESGFPGAGESGLLFSDGWTTRAKGNPIATKDVHHEINTEGVVMIIGWHLTINHVPGPLPERPEGWPSDGTHSTTTSRPSLSGG